MRFRQRLGRWLRDATASKAATVNSSRSATDLAADGHLPRGSRVAGKGELAATLRSWQERSAAPTVGDVDAFLRDCGEEPARPWRVVANARGRINKVLPNPDAAPLPGWYAYLTRPLGAPGLI